MTELDEVRELEVGRRAVAIRHVPHSLDVFSTHFPRFPVLPGVLIVDDLVTAARLLLTDSTEPSRTWSLATARQVRFRRFVEPGDSMEISVELVQLDGDTASFRGVIQVAGKPVTTVRELVLTRHGEEK